MKYQLSNTAKTYLEENNGASVIVAAEEANEAYQRILDLGVQCDEISLVLSNTTIAIEQIAKYGESAIGPLNVGGGLEDLLDKSEKEISAKLATETLTEKAREAWHWLVDKIVAMFKAIADFFKSLWNKMFSKTQKAISEIESAADKISDKEYKDSGVKVKIYCLKDKWTTSSLPVDFVIPLCKDVQDVITTVNATFVYNIMNKDAKKQLPENLVSTFVDKLNKDGTKIVIHDANTASYGLPVEEVELDLDGTCVDRITKGMDAALKEFKHTEEMVTGLSNKVEDVAKSRTDDKKETPDKEEVNRLTNSINYLRTIIRISKFVLEGVSRAIDYQKYSVEKAINQCEKKAGKDKLTNFEKKKD